MTDGRGTTDDASTNAGKAGRAGTDAFCRQLCDHAQQCASSYDASASTVANCMTNCQSSNESSSANPPTELFRADYVAALGACIAAASCGESLADSEVACASAIVYGSDAGTPVLEPTRAVAVFCRDVETSTCFARDSGVQDCETKFMLYSDDVLNSAIACFSSSGCSGIGMCYATAFTQ
jgi:hypothetical protein